jgi:hypothetical protein
MTKLSFLASAAVIAVAGISAAPAFAATLSGGVPYCNTGSNQNFDASKDQLAAQLQLSTKPNSTIDVWNNCLKVVSTEGGVTTVAFYDPDSLALIDTLGGSGPMTPDVVGAAG